jgi:hypothetical protein
VLKLTEEALVFEDAAKRKADLLLDEMITAARNLAAAHSTATFEHDHAHLVALQTRYRKALARVEFIADTLEAADKQRSLLWQLQEGDRHVLVATKFRSRQAAVLHARRHGAQVTCSDFEMYEMTGTGPRAVFKAIGS